MTDRLKEAVIGAINDRRDDIIAIGEDVFAHPEMGFKERRTAEVVKRCFEGLGLSYRADLAVTGLRADVRGRCERPRIAILGELDAIVCPACPGADPSTGAAHVCGHHAQIAALLGVAFGLVESGVMEDLDGSVALMAVPAEELVEIEYRKSLVESGHIRFMGGKQEFLRLGLLDDVDMAMMFHSAPTSGVAVGGSSNGFIAKSLRYVGQEAHAGASPHTGINALNAASLGIMGINCLRETFRDEDHVRVHHIITKGGDLVNVVPAEVRMEMFVRAATVDAILDSSRKVNRAMRAGAMAIGAEVQIEEIPGYLPLKQDASLGEVFKSNSVSLLGKGRVASGERISASTDMGDVSHVMPIIHPSIGGFQGAPHTPGFLVEDPDLAYVAPARLLASTIVDLLVDGAQAARRIKESYRPEFTTGEYVEIWDRLLKG